MPQSDDAKNADRQRREKPIMTEQQAQQVKDMLGTENRLEARS